MSKVGVVIILASVVASVAIAVLSHGRILLIGLPLMFGLPIAGMFGRRR